MGLADVAVASAFLAKRGGLGEEEEEEKEEGEAGAEVTVAHPWEDEGEGERDQRRAPGRQRRRRDDSKRWATVLLVLVALLAVAQALVERRCMACLSWWVGGEVDEISRHILIWNQRERDMRAVNGGGYEER